MYAMSADVSRTMDFSSIETWKKKSMLNILFDIVACTPVTRERPQIIARKQQLLSNGP
jgi:hypothetical protein